MPEMRTWCRPRWNLGLEPLELTDLGYFGVGHETIDL
jgi:hypothetical protein